ncbi:DUF3526 domain-containing protein [Fulvivirga kasyanovii]|uniref:DUF3526 domain-containing protein n=1 Tax=Fulvivirga kasyanovii TaxID=396812 RepID=A0ABW9RTE7_9BACT|nr:DUF3526 domain-containing protein [Fulvivirga kasyanovii]MTI26981.1 DUF3526 domain-containing protein [Fulvivirga kasyanovii]
MRNLLSIARKEIKIALRERLVVSLGIIILLLLGVALYGGYLSYRQQSRIITEKQEEKRKEWLGQGDKHPHIAAHYGTFVFKPKTILSVFDFGLDTYTGTSIYLEAHYQHEFMFRPAQDHSSMIRFGELSAALVLYVLLPLLIIFLAFSSYTKEKETGTLRLLLSQGASYSSITWGKVLAYSILLIVILAPYIAGMFILSSRGLSSAVVPDVAVRTVLLVLIYALYIFIFLSLSVWVSLKSATGRNALLTLLACWILLVILTPKAVANLSESFYTLPSMRAFKEGIQKDIRDGIDGETPGPVRRARLEKEYLTRYGVDSLHQLPFNFEGVSMQAGEEYGNMVYDIHWEKLRAIFHRQNSMGSIASIFNPYLAIQHLSMALSATDLYTAIDFEDKVEAYRRELVRKMNNDMAQNSRYGEFYEYKATRELWDEIEDFSYVTPSAFEILRYYKLEMISIVGWTTFVVLLLHYSNRKSKPIHG